MLIIRHIRDASRLSDRNAIGQVQAILRSRFPGVSERDVSQIPEQLTDPLKFRFRTSLLVAENRKGSVQGFSLMQFAPDLRFCFLDFIATRKDRVTGGIGASLYETCRQEAIKLNSVGLFYECLPDDPRVCKSEGLIRDNRARLKFYEQFGAFPLAGTAYETPITAADSPCPHFLVCDFLGQSPVSRSVAKKIIRAILERKYEDLLTAAYLRRVISSVKDDPVRLRPPQYRRTEKEISGSTGQIRERDLIPLIVNDLHSIHHIRERGYVESPVRISSILSELQATGLFTELPARRFSEKHITAVHDPGYIRYFKRVCESLPPAKSIYPYVFPVRNNHRAPTDDSVLAGYYCIDTFTPLNKNAFLAAQRAVDCALTGAMQLLGGKRAAYALVRPPGHHAEKSVFGGFCYFNSAAIAAHYLSAYGRVAMLDIDYHHGNGQQEIFYDRSDVLTLSIHGHPSFAYPYFTGFREETGRGNGEGYNQNYPLNEDLDGEGYRKVLGRAVERIGHFRPDYIVIPFGLDTARGDPTGTWSLNAHDFMRNGEIIGTLRSPVLFVQEGGYKNRVLGVNARNFFQGFHAAFYHLQNQLL